MGRKVDSSTGTRADGSAWATRIAGSGDLEVVAGLLLATDRHYWGERDGAAAAARRAAAAILSGSSTCRMLLGIQDDRPVAYITFALLYPSPNQGGALFMKDLFVIDEARGGGVGERMMRGAAALAVEWGCCRFDWTAETGNPRALAFYDRLSAGRVDEKVYFRVSGSDLARLADGRAGR